NRHALRGTPHQDEERNFPAEESEVRKAPEGCGSVRKIREQTGMDDSGRDPGDPSRASSPGAAGWRPLRNVGFERSVSPCDQPEQPVEEADGTARAGRDCPQ